MSAVTPLEGKHAVVTGASRGIGRAVAECLAGAGCAVAVSSRNGDESHEVACELAAVHRVPTLGARCDVRDAGEVHRFFLDVGRWSGGRLDALVCNAGYPLVDALWTTPLHATPEDRVGTWYTDVFSTDALGSVLCTRHALPLMMARGGGSIVYLSSTPALEGYRGTPYTVAKAAILGLMKEVALEYGPSRIRANALALGNIATEATRNQMGPELSARLAEATPLRRWGRPEEVARAVLFLVSDDSAFMTGQTLVLDGGNLRR